MSERARALKVGGALLTVLVIGLIVGFVLLGGNDAPPSNGSPSPTSTDVKTQVEAAYLDAWDVWDEAMRNLDPSRLSDAMTGRALQAVAAQVEEARRKNEPVSIEAEHNYRIDIVDATTASVDDNYINHSVRLDPETGQPKESPPSKRVHKSFTMRLVDGTWKLAEIIGFDS